MVSIKNAVMKKVGDWRSNAEKMEFHNGLNLHEIAAFISWSTTSFPCAGMSVVKRGSEQTND